jgi:hypothetical protein
LPFEKIDGPVLAISFESAWPGTPQNAREFSMALLDTAISNSVHRAKARLGSDRVFSMKTSLTTFDFDAAGRFSQEAAELTTRQAGDFVTDFVKRQQSAARALPGDPWEDLPVQELIKWWTVFRSQHRSGSSEYEHVTMVVQANCLVEDTTNTFFDLPDFVSYSIKFSPLDKMYCSALSLLPSTDVGIALSSTGVTLRDASGNDVGFVLVPARDPASTGRRPAIVFFTPPLDASTGPYVLSFRQHVRGFLGALKEKRRNDLSLSSRSASKKSGRMNLVLHVPNSYTEARLIAKPSNPGRPMTQAEANLFSAEPGFQPIGWVAEGLPPDSKVECDVLL